MRRVAIALAIMASVMAAPARADHVYGPVLVIDAESAKALMDRGERVQPIDVRPEAEFQAARLPGARSLPLESLATRLADVPRGGLIVLYAGASERPALVAYHLLRRERFTDVYVLEGGLPAWRSLGYRIDP